MPRGTLLIEGSEAGVPAAALATQTREVRKPSAGHYDPGCEELAAFGPEPVPAMTTFGAFPSPPNPGLPGLRNYRAQVGQARLAVGRG